MPSKVLANDVKPAVLDDLELLFEADPSVDQQIFSELKSIAVGAIEVQPPDRSTEGDATEAGRRLADFIMTLVAALPEPDNESSNLIEQLITELHSEPWFDARRFGDFCQAVATVGVEEHGAIRLRFARRRYAGGVLPVLTDIGATVELRAVQLDHYTFLQDPEAYEPRIAELFPVASITIGVDEGNPRQFSFQVGKKEIRRLLNHLRATEKDLEMLSAQTQLINLGGQGR